MDLNTYNLTPEEQCFMLANDNLFPLEVSTNIRLNGREWKETTFNILGEEKFNSIYNEKNKIISDIMNMKISGDIKMKLIQLLTSKSFTISDIQGALYSISNILDDCVNMDENNLSIIATVILTIILQFKLKSLKIGNKIVYDRFDIDNETSDLLSVILKSLVLNENDNLSFDACLIYLMYEILSIDSTITIGNKHTCQFDSLIKAYSIMKKFNRDKKEELSNRVASMNKDSILNEISFNNIVLPDKLYKYLYSRDINTASDHLIVPCKHEIKFSNNDIYYLKNFTGESLEDYVGSYRGLSFKIPEYILGYILKNEMFPISKIYFNNGKLYTIVSDNGINYMLFVSNSHPNRVFGLSIENDKNDSKKLLKVEVPENVRFRLLV